MRGVLNEKKKMCFSGEINGFLKRVGREEVVLSVKDAFFVNN